VAVQVVLRHILGELSRGWRGAGHRGINGPVEAFLRDTSSLALRLRDTADHLDAYGRQLQAAHHHHGFSLHKLLVIGAVVVVSTTAIVVTLGAAGVLEAAAAAEAVGVATEAAGAATAADVGAASGIDAAIDGISSIRPLLAFVVPHLVQVEWAAGGMAGWDEATTGRLRWRDIAETGAIAFVASGAAAKTTSMAADTEWLSPHVIQGTAWAGASAGDDAAVNHRISLLDVSESFVLAGGGNLARDALRERDMWPAEPNYRREALIDLKQRGGIPRDAGVARELAELRQPDLEIQRGAVDLRLNEDPGHTIDRHIGKTASELLARVRTSHLRCASTYWDDASAKDTIRRALSTQQDEFRRWTASGSTKPLRLRVTMPYDVGFAINAQARVTFVRQAIVVLRRDHAGVLVLTSFPLGRK
jgi:Bacterial CdiA-CT RNAse A domain